MHDHRSKVSRFFRATAVPVLLTASLATALAAAQPHSASPARVAEPGSQTIPTEQDVAATQNQLIELLRLSPTLTTVVSHDPSLLSDQEYVSRNNPQLAAFLAAHPEVARNPAFYLFSHMKHGDGSPDEALERAVWPDVYRTAPPESEFGEFLNHDFGPLAAFLGFLLVLLWLIRVFLENRRWSRIFKLQSDVHGRLIDKFSSNQDLALYMETDAGKRFLEAAPIPVNFEQGQRVPNAVARVLTPLQIGILLVLLGIGLLLLRHAAADTRMPMLILGTVVLMPGIGFIISAGITWVLAGRLGLMPDGSTEQRKFDPPAGSFPGPISGPREQQ